MRKSALDVEGAEAGVLGGTAVRLDRSSWLYFATRSLLLGAPVLIWQVFKATARSAIMVSSVSPAERWEAMAVYPALWEIKILKHGSDLVQLNKDGIPAAALADALCKALRVGHKQVVTHQRTLFPSLSKSSSSQPSQSSSSKPSSME